MIPRAPALCALLLLAACSGPSSAPQSACERQADNDPALKQDLAIAAGNLDWQWQNAGRIEAARRAAVNRCLSGGGRVRGGVERPQ